MSKAAELAKMGEVLTNSQIGGRRNIIINGAMQVAQRGTSFTLENNSIKYPVDRFFIQDTNSASGEATVSQSTTSPDGLKNSLKIDITTADTALAAADQYKIEHRIEGQDIEHLNYGTSTAKTVTLSFYIRSNKTGNTQVALVNSANDRYYVATFTIDSANTWERKELTIGGVTDGAWLNDNQTGLRLRWGSYGSNYQTSTLNQWISDSSAYESQANSRNDSPINFFDSTDNELYITGVQLEVGSQATPFENRSFGEEEELCKRYFVKHKATSPYDRLATGGAVTTDDAQFVFKFYPALRAVPTLTTGTLSHLGGTNRANGAVAIGTALSIDTNSDGPLSCVVQANDYSGDPLVAGEVTHLIANNNADAFVAFDAEL